MKKGMKIKEITKKYEGKKVVDHVSFEIPKGKVISLIGPNGAGKSTVMGILSRLIAKDSGQVDFEGSEISKWKSKELSKHLAILSTEQQYSDETDGRGTCSIWTFSTFRKKKYAGRSEND